MTNNHTKKKKKKEGMRRPWKKEKKRKGQRFCLENQKKKRRGNVAQKKKKKTHKPKQHYWEEAKVIVNKVRGRWESICIKCISQYFSLPIFLSNWEDKKSEPGGKTFSSIFCLSYFLSSTKQWKITFSTIFSSPYFPSSLFLPQPNTPLSNLSSLQTYF